MTDRPIIFSANMIRALLEGRKSQTRRKAWGKVKPTIWQKLRPGDRLWCRESFALPDAGRGLVKRRGLDVICYTADEGHTGPRMKQYDYKRKPSIHMPRWASRLTLIVTETKRERLQDISEKDAEAEGIGEPYLGDGDPPYEEMGVIVSRKMQFRNLWNTLHGSEAWTENPEVCAISFRCIKANIDAMEAEGADG